VVLNKSVTVDKNDNFVNIGHLYAFLGSGAEVRLSNNYALESMILTEQQKDENQYNVFSPSSSIREHNKFAGADVNDAELKDPQYNWFARARANWVPWTTGDGWVLENGKLPVLKFMAGRAVAVDVGTNKGAGTTGTTAVGKAGSAGSAGAKGAGYVKILPVKNTGAPGFVDLGDVQPGFKADIEWLYKYGITTGVDGAGKHFAPAVVVTRGQMASFLRRLAGGGADGAAGAGAAGASTAPANPTSCGFVDIGGAYAQAAADICWLKATGVTTGVDATHFAPEAAVTRGQMASFLRRIVGSPKFNGGTSRGFVDITGAYAQVAADICWLKTSGVTTGVDATHFAPAAAVTRGQMAAFLHRLFTWATK
jgi:hypothetical protein